MSEVAVTMWVKHHPDRTTWPAAIAGWLRAARVNHENYVHFRDDPKGNSDGCQKYRCWLWADLAARGYRDAALLRDLYGAAPVLLEG